MLIEILILFYYFVYYMQNTYQDLITDLEGKKPEISGKLEGGKKIQN